MTHQITISDWKLPGKILVVDDKFDTVKGFILDLTNRGLSVQFWDSKSALPNINNIRIVVLDLDLVGDPAITRADSNYFLQAAIVLEKIPGPYIVIILSEDYIETDPANLIAKYEEQFEQPIRGIVTGNPNLEKGFDFNKLFELIDREVGEHIVFKMNLLLESVIDEAKDSALGSFAGKKYHEQMISFIKTIKEDVGEESITREFTASMLRIVSRYIQKGTSFEKLAGILKQILTMEQQSSEDPLIPQLMMSYKPNPKEKFWTGDIFPKHDPLNLVGLSSHTTFEIILTPACDFAQEKAHTILLCEGFTIDTYESILSVTHPFRKIVKKIDLAKKYDQMGQNEKNTYLQMLLKETLKKIPRLYVLWNFNDATKNHVALCIDFQHTRTVSLEEFKKMNEPRILRIDSPFIEDMQQRYGSYSTRLGVPGSNSPI